MTRTRKDSGAILSSLLWGLQLLVAVVAVTLVYFTRLSIPPCGTDCDFSLLEMTWIAYAIVALGLFVGIGILQMLLPGTSRWWVPAIGIALTVGAAFVAIHVSEIALHLA